MAGQKKITRTYDLSQFPQPAVINLRATAQECQITGYKLAGQFRTTDAEVNLAEVEACAADLEALAALVREQVQRFCRTE